MDIGTLAGGLPDLNQRLADARELIGTKIAWYPYDILGNLYHLDNLLTGENRNLDRLAGGLPVADIGGADGDLAFVLEQACGWTMDIIDTAPTNMNGLLGARALREHFGSRAEIHDIDLDTQFRLPRDRYGLVIMLGILYHLQNPYYVLRELGRRTSHLLLSTRVARFAGAERTAIADLPVAYLVGPTETNNDATNYWMFSPAGLDRIVRRAGWTVLERASFGDVDGSDPSAPEHDERQFMLLRSHNLGADAVAVSGAPAGGSRPPARAPSSVAERDRRRDLRVVSRRIGGTARQLQAAVSRARTQWAGGEPAASAPAGHKQPTPAVTEPAQPAPTPNQPSEPGTAANNHSEPAPATTEPTLLCWPLDHFYSPVPDSRALAAEPARSRVWPPTPRATVGIDWQESGQEALLRDHLGRQPQLAFPDGPTGDSRDYHAANEMFSRLDAWMLQGILRHFKPKTMIEVGSGWSSLVTSRVNREYLGGELEFTCIDPYPPDFLVAGVEGISRLLRQPVEEVAAETFLGLQDRDVLFIDSSHTVKTGGDVTFLVQEVLPRLSPGVMVHFHDIFLPWDYPAEWVFAGRAWNEQYLVQSFLAFNSAFRVLLSVGWLSQYRRDLLGEVLPTYPEAYRDPGASLWIRRDPAEDQQ